MRGSGRFQPPDQAPSREERVSIPFIAGQWSLRTGSRSGRRPIAAVSIPFIAGQWSLPPRRMAGGEGPPGVSIPFIAGQWSLRLARRPGAVARHPESQSPSLRGSGRFGGAGSATPQHPEGLNPLHCGAVVASEKTPAPGNSNPILVSIPFIAGQWSLRRGASGDPARPCWSQSPSLRGSGRFSGASGSGTKSRPSSQSPSLRGSGRFEAEARAQAEARARVSIPFIAGQWSLPEEANQGRDRRRGVSIPFIAGQWSLRREAERARQEAAGLNPLHCGAVVASRRSARRGPRRVPRVSIPFIAGQWSLPDEEVRGQLQRKLVSIPFIAGQWSLHRPLSRPQWPLSRVSIPFIAGQWSLQEQNIELLISRIVSQSPSLRGSGRFVAERDQSFVKLKSLNPLHCGAVVASGVA